VVETIRRDYRGELGDCLAAVEKAPEPAETMPTGGAELAAEIIAGRIAG
jgi:hypothetical protein